VRPCLPLRTTPSQLVAGVVCGRWHHACCAIHANARSLPRSISGVRQTFSPIARSVFQAHKVMYYPDVIRTHYFFSAADYRPCFDDAYRSSLRDRSTGVGRKHPSVFRRTSVPTFGVRSRPSSRVTRGRRRLFGVRTGRSVVAACDARAHLKCLVARASRLRLVAYVSPTQVRCVRKVERAHFRRARFELCCGICILIHEAGGAACLS
jgi:hypothetical protein